VDELDGPHIDAARRLGGEEQAEIAPHLARDDDLLLVPAGERTGRERRVGGPNVEGAYLLRGVLGDRPHVERRTAEVVLPAEDQVVGDRVVEDEPSAVAILGDVREPGVGTRADAEGGDVAGDSGAVGEPDRP